MHNGIVERHHWQDCFPYGACCPSRLCQHTEYGTPTLGNELKEAAVGLYNDYNKSEPQHIMDLNLQSCINCSSLSELFFLGWFNHLLFRHNSCDTYRCYFYARHNEDVLKGLMHWKENSTRIKTDLHLFSFISSIAVWYCVIITKDLKVIIFVNTAW